MQKAMTLEKIQHEISGLHHDMRGTNVRSLGLKVRIHERWCLRMEIIAKMVKQYEEEQAELAEPVATPPTPPLSV